MAAQIIDRLLDEVEEEYAVGRVLPLYVFAWSLAGLGQNRSDAEFRRTCREAFDMFVRNHPDLRLVEVPWPVELARARPVADGSPIVLDLDPDTPPSAWLQVLVHPDELPLTLAPMGALRYLMACYFHQDWVMEGRESSDVVSAFLRADHDLAAPCAEQIDELLQQDIPAGGLAPQLVAWGCDYHAGETDQDYRAWLREIRQQIEEELRITASSKTWRDNSSSTSPRSNRDG